MSRFAPLHAATLVLSALCLAPAAQADSFTSSASSAGSASSGSISDSIGGSSDSSKDDKKVAEGEYRVMDVATAPDRPDTLRFTLRATDPAAPREFVLFVPRQALAERPVATGDRVLTRARPYGFEFAHADTRQPFFLALTDEWQRDMASRVVRL